MSKRALILVEGQTEERFVKDLLGPALWEKDLFFTPTILATKRDKGGTTFKGGVTNFTKFHNDTRRLLNSAGGALVTTMVDYYGLPSDFPGMDSRPPHGTPIERVTHIENSIMQSSGSPANFLPFLALHEFEAWLFSSAIELPRTLSEPRNTRNSNPSVRVFPRRNKSTSGPNSRLRSELPDYFPPTARLCMAL